MPHTARRYQAKRFRKAQCPIVERLTNSLMMHGRNNGKKLMAVWIVKHAMEIIKLLTDSNPIQVIVDAIINRYQMSALSALLLGFNATYFIASIFVHLHILRILLLLTRALYYSCLTYFLCSGPREYATRIWSAGVVRRQAVDISPLRRVNQAIYLLTTGARESAFRNIKTIAECLADELINAAKGSSNRYVICFHNCSLVALIQCIWVSESDIASS